MFVIYDLGCEGINHFMQDFCDDKICHIFEVKVGIVHAKKIPVVALHEICVSFYSMPVLHLIISG